MESKRVTDSVVFSDEKLQKNSLFDSQRLFYDVYCLLPGQTQKVHAHDDSDKVYYVLEGTGHFTVGEEEEGFGEGYAVIARAGESHGVHNDSEDNLVLLVTMAPPPA